MLMQIFVNLILHMILLVLGCEYTVKFHHTHLTKAFVEII